MTRALPERLPYNNSSAGTEQHEVLLPWSLYFAAPRGFFAYISAQNKGEYGRVKVQILLNGVSVKTSESSAKYGIATASGRI